MTKNTKIEKKIVLILNSEYQKKIKKIKKNVKQAASTTH